MRLAIIGGGRVGRALGRLARNAGYEIGEVVCRKRVNAARAVAFIGSGVPQSVAGARISYSDVILISTPDDSIGQATELIRSRYEQSDGDRQTRPTRSTMRMPVVLHASGALSSEILEPLLARGFSIGSCHPLQTFESPASAIELIDQSFFCIEGDKRAVRAARKLVADIGGRCFQIPTDLKSLYHAAAFLASGGIVGLISISLEALARCGLEGRQARAVLMPLVRATVANIQVLGPERALTGPVRRGDVSTIKRNLDALRLVDPQWSRLYKLLAEQGAQLMEQSPANAGKVSEIRKSLQTR
ncbi:MAG TPA: DUF2520 domain-containing protein [Blastocatellia bacterium]|nr:DUF2520 domain-containing protein [Blastocatellia bacterium]